MRWLALIGLLLASLTAGADPTDQAASALPPPPQETRGDVPLSEPIAPVPSGLARWSFAFSSLVGIADPFYDKVMLLGSVRRGIVGNWAVEAFGGRAFSWSGPALSVCTSATSCASPSAQNLNATPGALTYIGGVAGVWQAAHGKLSVGGLAPVKFALEASLGAAAVAYQFDIGKVETLWSPAARAGLGVSASVRPDLAVRLDLQGLFYESSIRNISEFDRQMLLGLSLSWRPGGQP